MPAVHWAEAFGAGRVRIAGTPARRVAAEFAPDTKL
jgi:hypothetical protein